MKQTVSELYAEANKSGPGVKTMIWLFVGCAALAAVYTLLA